MCVCVFFFQFSLHTYPTCVCCVCQQLAVVSSLELILGRDFYSVARFQGGRLSFPKRLLALIVGGVSSSSSSSSFQHGASRDSPSAISGSPPAGNDVTTPPAAATTAGSASSAAAASSRAASPAWPSTSSAAARGAPTSSASSSPALVAACLVRVLALVGAAGLASSDLKHVLRWVASPATPRILRGALVAVLPTLAGPRLPESGHSDAWTSGAQLNPSLLRRRSSSVGSSSALTTSTRSASSGSGSSGIYPSGMPSASRAFAGALLSAAGASAQASAEVHAARAAVLRELPPPSCFFCLGGRGQSGGATSLEHEGQGEADALRMPFKAWPFEAGGYQVKTKGMEGVRGCGAKR